jgi:hypothetical protein
MQFYTVHEPPDAPADRIDRADTLTFIHDGFCKAAVAFGALWLIANQLWIAFAGYLAIAGCIALGIYAAGVPLGWIALLVGALNLLLGFEASSLQRWTLERGGWRSLGTVSGRSLDECERRFLESWLADQRTTASSAGGASGPGFGAQLGSQLAAMADGSSQGRLGRRERTGLFGGSLGGLFGLGARR